MRVLLRAQRCAESQVQIGNMIMFCYCAIKASSMRKTQMAQAGIKALKTEERKAETNPNGWYDLSRYVFCSSATDLLRFDSPIVHLPTSHR